MSFVIHNGEIHQAETFSISIKNRAFRFGDGFFETMRISNGHILFLGNHLKRMQKALELMRIDPNPDFSKERIQELAKRLCKASGSENLRLRLSVFRTEGGLYTPINNKSDYLLEAWLLESPFFEWDDKGGKLVLFEETGKCISAFSSFKSLNTTLYTLAGLFAKEHQADDAIFLNQKGGLCEATSSNVFFVKNDVLKTPHLSSGCVNGTMRKQVLKIAASLDIPIEEREILADELLLADEIFLTNAMRGVFYIREYAGRNYDNASALLIHNTLNTLIH